MYFVCLKLDFFQKKIIDSKVWHPSYNDVSTATVKCTKIDLEIMGNRMIDWFSVLMQNKENTKPEIVKIEGKLVHSTPNI